MGCLYRSKERTVAAVRKVLRHPTDRYDSDHTLGLSLMASLGVAVRIAEISRQDVEQTEDRTIHLETIANDILVGGMSYELDPMLEVQPPQYPTRESPPQYPARESAGCEEEAKELLDCLDLPVDKVRSVRVRKITMDIEIEDEHRW